MNKNKPTPNSSFATLFILSAASFWFAAESHAQIALPEPTDPPAIELSTPPGGPAASPQPQIASPTRPLDSAGAAAAVAQVSAGADGIRMNFQGATLSDVLNYLSEAAGFVIVQEAPVTGTVNIVSRQAITPDEAVDLVNAVLVEKGFIAIRNGRILKIVNRRDAQKRDLPVLTGSDPELIPRKDEMVTQILPLRYGEAAKLVENLRPLLAESATISSNEASNAILLTDTQTNIRRMAQIIQALDTSVSSISSIRVFPLRFADPKELANVVTQLFATPQTTRGGGDQGRGGRGGFPGFGGFGGRGRGEGGNTAAQSEARQAASRVVAVGDEQSNSLIVSAPDDAMPTISDIVTQIDTSIVDATDTRIFRLMHADALELAQLVTSMYTDTASQSSQGRNRGDRGDRRGQTQPQAGQATGRALIQSRVVAVGDPRTNSLVVTAALETMMQIAEMIGRLDETNAKKQRVYVHSLEHADADSVAALLRGMLSGGSTQQTQSILQQRTTTGATIDATSAGTGGGGGGGGGGRTGR